MKLQICLSVALVALLVLTGVLPFRSALFAPIPRAPDPFARSPFTTVYAVFAPPLGSSSPVRHPFIAPVCPADYRTLPVDGPTPTLSDAYTPATPTAIPGTSSTPQPNPQPANEPPGQVPLSRFCAFFCSVEVAETISWLGPVLVGQYGYFSLDQDFARAPRAVDLEAELRYQIYSVLGLLISTVATITQFFCLRSDLRWSAFTINFISWTGCVWGASGATAIFDAHLKEFSENFEARKQELDSQGIEWVDARTEMEKMLMEHLVKPA